MDTPLYRWVNRLADHTGWAHGVFRLYANYGVVLFGAALLGALAYNKLLLPVVLDSVMSLTEEGWRKLTVRWGVFFFALAILNEIVWRKIGRAHV